MRATLLLGLTLGPSLPALLPAQELVWERVGVQGQNIVGGGAVVALGDINRDRYDDLLHMANTIRCVGTGRDLEIQLWLLSGRDGRTLRVRPRFAQRRSYWTIAAAGDVDADGTPDYAVTILDIRNPPTANVVQVCSGKDDRVIWQVSGPSSNSFGWALLGGLDLDGDRRPDLVVGGMFSGRLGVIYAYSSKGKLLYQVKSNPQFKFPFTSDRYLGRVGDVDRDGIDDYVVGANDVVGLRHTGIVLSGKTGKVLVRGLNPWPGEALGWAVDGCGDLDGDGVPDFAAGSAAGAFSRGAVAAFSGSTGKVILKWDWTQPTITAIGWSVRSGGMDLDRDGVPDLVVGGIATTSKNDAVAVFSGRDGKLIHQLDSPRRPPARRTSLGQDLEVLPPQPGSQFPLFATGELGYGHYDSYKCGFYMNLPRGRLRLWRGSPAGVQTFGAACRGSLATSPKIGIRDLQGKGARIHLSEGASGSPALLLLGLSRSTWGTIPLPLALDPLG
ncbi:MAG: hypothetical protein ACE5EV_08325, partial [Gaiellales bacterium]